jgi:transposase InsO family protein
LAHFLPVKTTYRAKQYAELYLTRIVCLHSVPKTIVSDRGPQFVAQFWKSLYEAMGTDLTHSTAYHPQTDGQTERVNQILEDMLRACALIYEKKCSLACRSRSFPITIVTKQVLKYLLLKPSMDDGVERLSIGPNLGKGLSLARIW